MADGTRIDATLALNDEAVERIAQRAAALVLEHLNGIAHERWLNAREVAELLSTTERRVKSLARLGLIPHSRVDEGRKELRLVFALSDVQAWYRDQYEASPHRVEYKASEIRRKRQALRDRLRRLAVAESDGDEGYVYLGHSLLGGDLIKIGWSSDPPQRARDLHMELLLVVPGSRSLESELKKTFDYCRRQGEWFAPDPELLAYIADHQAERSKLEAA